LVFRADFSVKLKSRGTVKAPVVECRDSRTGHLLQLDPYDDREKSYYNSHTPLYSSGREGVKEVSSKMKDFPDTDCIITSRLPRTVQTKDVFCGLKDQSSFRLLREEWGKTVIGDTEVPTLHTSVCIHPDNPNYADILDDRL